MKWVIFPCFVVAFATMGSWISIVFGSLAIVLMAAAAYKWFARRREQGQGAAMGSGSQREEIENSA